MTVSRMNLGVKYAKRNSPAKTPRNTDSNQNEIRWTCDDCDKSNSTKFVLRKYERMVHEGVEFFREM